MTIEGILGRKLGMSQVFEPDGSAVPVTVIEALPCTVVQVKTKERDWIVGDTLTATFVERRTRADSAGEPALRTLVAWGNAQSYYQVPPEAGRDSLPSLSYVAGRRILIDFDNGEISSVRVLEEVRGILLEPVRRDTTGAVRRAPAPSKPR